MSQFMDYSRGTIIHLICIFWGCGGDFWVEICEMSTAIYYFPTEIAIAKAEFFLHWSWLSRVCCVNYLTRAWRLRSMAFVISNSWFTCFVHKQEVDSVFCTLEMDISATRLVKSKMGICAPAGRMLTHTFKACQISFDATFPVWLWIALLYLPTWALWSFFNRLRSLSGCNVA